MQQAQYQAGNALVSRTTLGSLPDYPGQQIVCLRAVLSNPLTGEDDLRCVLEDQQQLGAQLEHSDATRRAARAATSPSEKIAQVTFGPGANGELEGDRVAVSSHLTWSQPS